MLLYAKTIYPDSLFYQLQRVVYRLTVCIYSTLFMFLFRNRRHLAQKKAEHTIQYRFISRSLLLCSSYVILYSKLDINSIYYQEIYGSGAGYIQRYIFLHKMINQTILHLEGELR